VTAAEEVDARAESLLAANLTPRQRAEYAATGRITIVKDGVVWGVVLPQAAKVLPILALFAVPGWRVAACLLLVTFVATLAPFWLPRFTVATSRRRRWIVSARSSPVVLARGRSIRFCVAFKEYLPDADRVLAWKNLLEVSEAHFLRTANVR
jgi:hypothetical protein